MECHCGCGAITPLVTRTRPHLGTVKGQHVRFVKGHGRRIRPIDACYPHVSVDGRATPVHRLRAEKAIGRPLSVGVLVHHADGSKRGDAPLVICQDRAYHALLHARMRIQAAGGNPNTDRICGRCKGVKHVSAFGRNRHGVFGASNTCKACTRRLRSDAHGHH